MTAPTLADSGLLNASKVTKSVKTVKRHKLSQSKNHYWKQKKKDHHWTLPISLIVVLISLVVIIRFVTLISNDFTRPLAPDQGVLFFNGVVDERSNIVVGLRNPQGQPRLFLLGVDQNQKQSVIIELDTGLPMDTPLGLGKHALADFFEMEKLPQNVIQKLDKHSKEQVMTAMVREFFAVPVDGYLFVAKPCLAQDQWECVKELLGPNLLLMNLPLVNSSTVNSNFSLWQLSRLGWQLNAIREDKVRKLRLDQLNVVTTKDNQLYIDGDLLDQFVQKYFSDSQVAGSGLNIEVANGTSHPGLGFRMSRFITNMGGKVVHVGNFDRSDVDKSVVIGNNLPIAKQLAEACGCVMIEQQVANRRGDIVVVAGEDYWLRLNGW